MARPSLPRGAKTPRAPKVDAEKAHTKASQMIGRTKNGNFAAAKPLMVVFPLRRAEVPLPVRTYQYNNGYGDFCFDLDAGSEGTLDGQNAENSGKENNVLFAEIGDFTRSGPFPFLRLPKLIRLEIFKLLCSPFFNDDGSISMTLRVDVLDAAKSEWCNTGLEAVYMNRESLKPGSELLDTESEFPPTLSLPELQQRFTKRNSPHPLRKWSYYYGYRLSAYPRMQSLKNDGSFLLQTDPSMFQLVRDVSNVNTQFRAELGKVLFGNVKLTLGEVIHPENMLAIICLRGFVTERPIAWIRQLNILLEPVELEDGEQSPYAGLFACIADMKLQVLQLSVNIDYTSIEEMAEGSGVLTSIIGVRDIPVTRKFLFKANEISMHTEIPVNENSVRSEVLMVRMMDLWKEHYAEIRNHLLPFNLRPECDDEKNRNPISRATRPIKSRKVAKKRVKKRDNEASYDETTDADISPVKSKKKAAPTKKAGSAEKVAPAKKIVQAKKAGKKAD